MGRARTGSRIGHYPGAAQQLSAICYTAVNMILSGFGRDMESSLKVAGARCMKNSAQYDEDANRDGNSTQWQ